MSRQLEQMVEERGKRRNRAILKAVEYELESAIERSGASLVGLSVNFKAGGCLITVKGHLAGRRQVCFIGADNFGDALCKVVREASKDSLKWRDDKYSG